MIIIRAFSLMCILFVAIILSGCRKDNHIEKPSSIFQARFEKSQVIDADLSDFFEIDQIISLETTDKSVIGNVNALVIKNDKIYILDKLRREVLIFSDTGKYLSTLSRLGSGPYEYIDIGDIDVLDGKLYLSDIASGRFLTFDANLNPLFETREFGEIMSFCMLEAERLVYYTGNLINENTKIDANLYNNVGFRTFKSFEKGFLPYNLSHRGITFSAGNSKSSFIQRDNDVFYFNSPRMTIYQVEDNSNLREYFKVSGQPDDFNESIMSVEAFEKAMGSGEFPHLMLYPHVGEQFVYYRFFAGSKEPEPALRGLFLKNKNKNIVFNWERFDKKWNLPLSAVPYKGNNVGLVCSVDPSRLPKSDLRGTTSLSAFKQRGISEVKVGDNPLLVFLKLREEFL